MLGVFSIKYALWLLGIMMHSTVMLRSEYAIMLTEGYYHKQMWVGL